MSRQVIYSMEGVGKIYPPNKQVLKDIYLSYFYGAKIGVLGLNGAGKSSLLRIMAGVDQDYIGKAVLTQGYTVGYLPQEPELDKEKTVIEVVREGVKPIMDLLAEYEAVSAKFADPNADYDKLLARQAELQDQIEAKNAWEIDVVLEKAMDALRCPDPDAKIAHLSGGEKRRVALCRLLLQQPDILLLDEPTNHLDAESVHWLEQHLKQYKGTVIAVTHDRYFLDNVAEWILELDRGQGIPWHGNYSSWLQQKKKRLEQEEKQASQRKKTLERELEWISMTPSARRTKNKARINAYEKLLSEETKAKIEELEIFIPISRPLGNIVIEFEGVSKSYGDRLLMENVTFSIPKGAVVGIIGPNGAGKTTLFRMIVGKEKPDTGIIRIGETVDLGYVDQEHDALIANADKSVYEFISEGNENIIVGGKSMNARAYLSKFNFTGSDQSKKVNQLSGGERNRLHLAYMLKSGSNVLLLDEPTNDIDVNTLRALEEAINNYAGCALIISHDRWFLDRVATHILAFEGDSQVRFFEGNFQEYEEDRKKRLGKDAIPKRIRYKKLI
ncbi:MAG: energy-dependent translational throttle protein EttA [Bacteroidia bacterium]|nr:energy-dependent translational throttle protein EttA [Bacteroidia bacterium]